MLEPKCIVFGLRVSPFHWTESSVSSLCCLGLKLTENYRGEVLLVVDFGVPMYGCVSVVPSVLCVSNLL